MDQTILHKMTNLWYPNLLIWLASVVHKEQLTECDSHGRIPLHCVAEKTREFCKPMYLSFTNTFKTEMPHLFNATPVVFLSQGLNRDNDPTSSLIRTRYYITTTFYTTCRVNTTCKKINRVTQKRTMKDHASARSTQNEPVQKPAWNCPSFFSSMAARLNRIKA